MMNAYIGEQMHLNRDTWIHRLQVWINTYMTDEWRRTWQVCGGKIRCTWARCEQRHMSLRTGVSGPGATISGAGVWRRVLHGWCWTISQTRKVNNRDLMNGILAVVQRRREWNTIIHWWYEWKIVINGRQRKKLHDRRCAWSWGNVTRLSENIWKWKPIGT